MGSSPTPKRDGKTVLAALIIRVGESENMNVTLDASYCSNVAFTAFMKHLLLVER